MDSLDQWLVLAGGENLPSGAAYLPGDANLDGAVNGADFVAWNQHKFTTHASWCGGDFNADGNVGGADFVIWNTHKFTSAADAPAVPEPTGLTLWSLALAAAICVRCRS